LEGCSPSLNHPVKDGSGGFENGIRLHDRDTASKHVACFCEGWGGEVQGHGKKGRSEVLKGRGVM
jgi:hypothetical protein